MNQDQPAISEHQELSATADSDDEFLNKIRGQIAHMEDEEKSQRIVSRNEQVAKAVAFEIPESRDEREIRFKYTPSVGNLKEVGKVEVLTKESIVIFSQVLPEFVINLDQLLLTQDQQILGPVDDVFGKIERPHYSIILDGYTRQLVRENRLQVGDSVFINLDHASILDQLTIQQLATKKGCDASNQFDEEIVNPNEQEFSDDESESKVKRPHKKKEDGEVKPQKHKKDKPQRNQSHQQEQAGQQPHHQHNHYRGNHPQQNKYPQNQKQLQYQSNQVQQMQMREYQEQFIQQQMMFQQMQFQAFQQQQQQQMQFAGQGMQFQPIGQPARNAACSVGYVGNQPPIYQFGMIPQQLPNNNLYGQNQNQFQFQQLPPNPQQTLPALNNPLLQSLDPSWPKEQPPKQ